MTKDNQKITDYISGSQIQNKPEEIEAVQPLLKRLVEDYHYPRNMIVAHPQWHVKSNPSDINKNIRSTLRFLILPSTLIKIYI